MNPSTARIGHPANCVSSIQTVKLLKPVRSNDVVAGNVNVEKGILERLEFSLDVLPMIGVLAAVKLRLAPVQSTVSRSVTEHIDPIFFALPENKIVKVFNVVISRDGDHSLVSRSSQ